MMQGRPVIVGHRQDVFPRVLPDHFRVIGGDMRLDLLENGVFGLGLYCLPTRAMHDLHRSLLVITPWM
jgi:hypothetical protein